MRNYRPTLWPCICLAPAICLLCGVADARSRVEVPLPEPIADSRAQFQSQFPPQRPYRYLEGELCRLEVHLFADAADGHLDEHSLLAAALVASGVDDQHVLRHYEQHLADLVAQLARSGQVKGNPRRQARAVFEFLHRRVLRGGYRLQSTDLTVALDEGRFNCVSASVLYICLLGRFGVTAYGLEVPGHAMARLVLPSGTLDVETTCPGWFRLLRIGEETSVAFRSAKGDNTTPIDRAVLSDDPQRLAELVEKTTGFRRDSGGGVKELRQVSGVELVATIYYNRGVDLLAEAQFAAAAAANAKALRLDQANQTARGNLLATLNNWAISLSSDGQYAEAIDRLRQGIRLQPDYETFAANFLHVNHQWIERLVKAGQYEEARDVAADALWERPGEPGLLQAQLNVYQRWARGRLVSGRPDEAFALFDELRERVDDNQPVRRAEVVEVNNRALALLERRQFKKAVELLESALARQPDVALLADNRRAAVMRWAQPAFRKGDYAEAIRRTTHGAVPGRLHETLVGNVRYGYHQWVSALRQAGRDEEADRIFARYESDPFLAGVGASSPTGALVKQ